MAEYAQPRWRFTLATLLLLAGVAIVSAGVATHAATSAAQLQEVIQAKTVKAEKFVVVDKEGHEWIKMFVAEDGTGAAITFRDKKKHRGSILMTDSRMSLTLGGGKESKSELMLHSSEDDMMVAFHDQKGKTRAGIVVGSAGMGINFFGSKGEDKGALHFSEEGTGGLKLYDGSGKLVWKAPP